MKKTFFETARNYLRKLLKKEVREMNATFKAEMAEMEAEEQLIKG